MSDQGIMLVVAAAMVNAQGRVLVQQRAPGRPMAGLWEFPGGKLEAGEPPEEGLARELAEELGIAVAAENLVPAFFASADNAGRAMILLLFVCRDWSGEPRALDAAALSWVRPEEMADLAMPPADEPLVEMLKKLL